MTSNPEDESGLAPTRNGLTLVRLCLALVITSSVAATLLLVIFLWLITR